MVLAAMLAPMVMAIPALEATAPRSADAHRPARRRSPRGAASPAPAQDARADVHKTRVQTFRTAGVGLAKCKMCSV
eukprot:6181530-Pleurochrysis_carterae.AAC.1